MTCQYTKIMTSATIDGGSLFLYSLLFLVLGGDAGDVLQSQF